MNHLQQEKQKLVSKYEEEKEELTEELLSLQQERDESLLLLENDKQKVSREVVTRDSFASGRLFGEGHRSSRCRKPHCYSSPGRRCYRTQGCQLPGSLRPL